MEVDEQRLLEAVRTGIPDAQLEHLPVIVGQSVSALVKEAIPGHQANGTCAIPELQVSSIIKPSSRIVV